MKSKAKLLAGSHPPRDNLLERILRQAGSYYHSADFFYHRLWRQRLRQIGFRVMSVERLAEHPIWRIRLCGNLTVQAYLLVSKPMGKRNAAAKDPLLAQLKSEIQEIARDLGKPLKRDQVMVGKQGAYFQLGLVWSPGQPGLLLTQPKELSPFSLLIRPWLRRTRN